MKMIIVSFKIGYNPDLNEGRGFRQWGIVRVLAHEHHKLYCENWCYRRFGNRVSYVMSEPSSPVKSWKIFEISEEEVERYELIISEVSKEEVKRRLKIHGVLAKISPFSNNQGYENFLFDL